MPALRWTSMALLGAAALGAACGGDGNGNGARQLTVMTQNLYLGADLTPALTAQTGADLAAAATQVWAMVQKNDFTERAKAVAAEIAAAKPDLVGLQEVSLWRTQTPGDAAAGGQTPATTVAYDFLELLLAELRARGATYTAAATVELTDIEVPTADGIDVRLTDRDVILARDGVDVANPRQGVYQNLLPVTVAGQSRQVKRGWTRVTGSVGGKTFSFVNTHLEAFFGQTRSAQALELAQLLAADAGPVIWVGDLNSTPGSEGATVAANAGFADAWATTHAGEAGLTCCWPEDLSLSTPGLLTRIDYVLTRGAVRATGATVVGEAAEDRTAGGRWPSDHAGLVATLQVD